MDELLNIILKQVVSVAVGGACVYFKMCLKAKQDEYKAKEDDDKLRRKVDRVILRNTIRQACKKRIAKGWVELDEKNDILECYAAYEDIIRRDNEQNGVLEDLIKRYRTLSNEPPKEGSNEH